MSGRARRLRLADGRELDAEPSRLLGPAVLEAVDELQGRRRLFRLDAEGRPEEASEALAPVLAERLAAARKAAQTARTGRQRALRRATALEPLDHQQAHSPTRPVELVVRRELVSDGRGGISHVAVTRRQGMRRLVDARLWESLAPGPQRAAERIAAGFAVLSRGLGAKTSALGRPRIDGTPREADYAQDLVDDYFRWGRACGREGVEHAAVMDVLGYGFSCAETDRRRRRRKGWAAAELRRALGLYCRLRGWPAT